MEEGAEGGEVVKLMDGWICFGGRLGGGEVGLSVRGVGWDGFFFLFLFLFLFFLLVRVDFVGGE